MTGCWEILCTCGHKFGWHHGKQDQKHIIGEYPKLFEKGNVYTRTCYGIGCTCGMTIK